MLSVITIWLFNIAMENCPFIDGLPGFTYQKWWFYMAMLNNQRVYHIVVVPNSWSNSPTRLKHRPIPRTMGCTRPWSRVEYAKRTFQRKVTTILHLYHVPSGFLFVSNNKDKDKRAEMLWEAKQWDAKNDWPGTKKFGLETTQMDSETTEPDSDSIIWKLWGAIKQNGLRNKEMMRNGCVQCLVGAKSSHVAGRKSTTCPSAAG